jgi:hypothetical protein
LQGGFGVCILVWHGQATSDLASSKHRPIFILTLTYYSTERAGELREKGLSPLTDDPNDEYRTNIQISELNALRKR